MRKRTEIPCKAEDATGTAPPNITIGTEIDDSVITTRVKSALLADSDVKSFDFKVETRKGEVTFDTDEHVKADTSMETLGKMRPAFKKDGAVTAGNASGINDAAAAVVLAAGDAVKAQNLKPLADAGQVRLLMVAGPNRSPAVPDVPITMTGIHRWWSTDSAFARLQGCPMNSGSMMPPIDSPNWTLAKYISTSASRKLGVASPTYPSSVSP